jgi:alpha-beta hydrolase superfamily lysophospholipase
VTVRWGTEALAARATIHKRAAEIRVPLLLVHGEADNIAAVRGSVELFERVGSHDKQLLTYPAALHELHNDTNREQVIEDYRLWLQRQCLACSNRT